jgi:hypothetical protein
MGSGLQARMLAELPHIPELAQGLASLLADLAHDGDDRPCVWASPETLTARLYGVDNDATRRKFERRVVMLLKAGIVQKASKPHKRPARRACPRDGRKLHLEVMFRRLSDREIFDAGRRLSDAEIFDAERRLNAEVDDAGGRLPQEDIRRPAEEIFDAGRRSLKELPREQPSDAAERPNGAASDRDAAKAAAYAAVAAAQQKSAYKAGES